MSDQSNASRLIEAIQVDSDTIPQLADLFSLLGDASRLRIVTQCLIEYVNVSDLVIATGLSQPLVSHHLRLLKAARMVVSERRGKQMFYRAADHHVQCVINDMIEHVLEGTPQVTASHVEATISPNSSKKEASNV